MLYIRKIFEKTFKGKTSKDAYLHACKFVASKVISKASKVEAGKIVWDIAKEEDDEASLPTFRLTLYHKFDDAEFSKLTCKSCKQFHKSFFINEQYDCNRCKKAGYLKQVEEKLSIGAEYSKRKIDEELSK